MNDHTTASEIQFQAYQQDLAKKIAERFERKYYQQMVDAMTRPKNCIDIEAEVLPQTPLAIPEHVETIHVTQRMDREKFLACKPKKELGW